MRPKDWDKNRKNPNSYPAKKKSNYCKKLKGDHRYIFSHSKVFRVKFSMKQQFERRKQKIKEYDWIRDFYFCEGCNKKKVIISEKEVT